ncbi:uncharacterized protein LOC110815800 [Carica papaya]|uniref:uncharacterized protein LOC110815800 n=1 Tax=Carica papaya TaxID=3649 RepID=UPI000B8C8554|nr:uncharacterized protein LOC110815800 [Carica papaya]
MDKDTVLQQQRKRTMEALERRFASAKVEVLQQQKKQNTSVGRTETDSGNASTTSNHLIDPSANPPSNMSFKKDAEENHPAYSQLSQPMNDNLLTTNTKSLLGIKQLSSRKGTIVDKILHDLLQSGDSAQRYMQGSKSSKIDNWILLDNFVQGRGISTGSRMRALQSHSKRSKKHMSMRQLKKSCAFDLPKDFQKFNKFELMHDMWKSYVAQLLKAAGKNQLSLSLLNADLHGAMILGLSIFFLHYDSI